MIKEELWQGVLAQIQLSISPANFSTWFKNTEICSFKDGEVIVLVPNSFVKEWLENKYHKAISKILREMSTEIKEIKYVVGRQPIKPVKKEAVPITKTNQLEFNELKIDKETNLNPRYSFENFVVGPFNELPHAAACAVTKNPGNIYNPLFIYGGVGLGKTHLIQAIGNEVLKNSPERKIKYLPSERFMSEVVTSIGSHSMETFKLKYQIIDILIIDDIQFLAGKEKTQEEFFHLFNTLYEKNKQIIISSDRPPKAIPALTERLRSRFEGGMTADIGYPDFETRMAILKAKAREKNVSFPEDAYVYIATNIQRNIRELEGALNRLIVHQNLRTQPLDSESAKSLLKKLLFLPAKATTPQKIIHAVASFYDLKEKDILIGSRKKEIVRPRQIATFLMREDLKNSYPFIGRKLGGRDHTTAIHSYEKIRRELEINETLKEEIELIRQMIFNI
ncbi:MAG: chromosomal replication initiator protein DnaA [Candidatus Nealsonbacteria bacterium CG08_land_8_20_14_0_20_43_11]|uniref:Chromosomal replication initiator protein DnaA n=1 Tax=Candidatus Nealsonbacteria bacterium CG08_land_8_20_14_0_20_43_11 TaxID=1974706 RepID=A0A2M6T043_9BACT|nr:MAG: chromosomal replication initiator protein DnaA [Candidatus Nealsonbacteria bacterium CG08_land_8_20_14_0_20_43_11]